MAMKKTSDGDSPLRQGAGKSLWTLPISGRRWRRIAMCFWKIDQVLIGEGASSEVDQGDLTCRGRGQGLGRTALVCGALVAPLLLLFGSLEASGKNKTSGTCFVQF
jgi:hypothetical protein